MALNIDRGPLTERQLRDRLVLAASQEGQGAAKDYSNKGEHRPDHRPIRVGAIPDWESEARAESDLLFMDENQEREA